MILAKVKPFAIEKWMDRHETIAKYNLAETCVDSITLDTLEGLSESKNNQIWSSANKLTYGPIRGSEKLRSNLATLYSAKKPCQANDILITPGAIAANLTVFYGLIGKGDHVICHYPTYQQLIEIPRSLGADVDYWQAREGRQWQLDIEELKALLRPNTKMIVINNPNNPTGAIVPKATLEELTKVAEEHDLIILSDEVYRPLFHSLSPGAPEYPPSIISLPYKKVIATGSLSKAYSLAGIRVGWIASKCPEIIEACSQARDYTTISVSQVDDSIATYALSQDCIHALLRRNLTIAKENVAMVAQFVEDHRWACEWIRPTAGTTAFVKFSKMGSEVDDLAFCESLMKETGVMLSPGSTCFGESRDFKGFVRFGFCCETPILKEGIDELRRFMKCKFKELPLAMKEAP